MEAEIQVHFSLACHWRDHPGLHEARSIHKLFIWSHSKDCGSSPHALNAAVNK
jgi:hypothetical protein